MANLGLVAKPNQDVHRSNNAPGIPEDAPKSVIELFDVPDSDELRRIKQQSRLPLNEEDQKYIAKCLAEHGGDYTQIFRDTKGVNYMQHTESQLRKMGSRFLLLSEEQRKVEVPEKVKALVQS